MSLSTTVPSLVSNMYSSTTSSSGLTTPSSSLGSTVQGISGIGSMTETRRDMDIKPKASGKDLDRVMMPPPPMPVTSIHAPTPPRMTRMPSLSEITSHLHIPSPLSSTTPKTPPRLSLLTTPSPTPMSASLGSATSPVYTASPSGRLKLPASAMIRTRSGSSSHTPTLASLSTPRGTLERRGSGETPMSREGSRAASPESAKNSPSTTADIPSPQPGSLRRQPSKEYVQGYRDVPSLAAIRQRISFSQSAGASTEELVDKLKEAGKGEKEKEAESEVEAGDLEVVETLLEDNSPSASASSSRTAVVLSEKRAEHPLKHPWTLYFDAKSYMPPLEQSAGKDGGTGMGDYEKSLLSVGKINTVEAFARHMNNLRLPSQLKQNSNYHLFKGNIRPMWEDPANSTGGKWVILFRQASHLLDLAWANLTMALVGQMLDPDDIVCGVVASNRPKIDRLQVWTRGREDVGALNELGKRCLDFMGVEKGEMECISMEFQYNASNAHPPTNAFLHIPFSSRNFSHSPSTPSRLGSGASPTLNLPSSGSAHLSPATSSTNPSPSPLPHLPPNPRGLNLSINVPHNPYPTPSPLSNNTRVENRPLSPGITPTPSPKMLHSLPRPPDSATIKASMLTTSGMGSPNLINGNTGGIGMKRLGSGQGANAFAGPMAGSRSPRATSTENISQGRLMPPSPVPAYGV